MTIILEKDTIGDKLLKIIGKKRAYKMPSGKHEKIGPYVHVRAGKENIITALLRPKGQEPSEGWFYWPDDHE